MPKTAWIAPWTAWWFNLVNYDANVGVVRAIYRCLDGLRVLDLGFGGGLALRALLAHSPSVMVDGVDASREMVRIATETFADDIRSGRLRLHHCYVGTDLMPFPAQTFDIVISVCAVPFWSDVRRVLAEVWYLLRPAANFGSWSKAIDSSTC